MEKHILNRSLSPFMIWGLGVGMVISGMYFGWNLGLEKGGTYGFGIATIFIIVLYITFTFSYAELACAIPKAGGAFDYANIGLGRHIGFVCGMAQIIEFVFSPPAIAAAIGSYFHIYFSQVPIIVIAIIIYVVFTGINIIGIRLAVILELIITILAIAELFLFAGLTLPYFEFSNLAKKPFPNGYQGIFASIPYAIWFFLAIEGIANLAEETIYPQKNILIGFGSTIATLVVLCLLTFISATGIEGWEKIVYTDEGGISDSPLPMALAAIPGNSKWMYHLLVSIGLLGLVASFHGIILAAGRATFEFGRVGNAPSFLGNIHSKFNTPANSLIINMLVGIIALCTGKTGEIIIIACFGALSLYILSLISLFVLRSKKPDLIRPFKVPCYPFFPGVALLFALISFVALGIYYPMIAMIYAVLLTVPFIGYCLLKSRHIN